MKIFWCRIVSRDFKLNTAVIDRGQALYFLSITKGIFPCNRCSIYRVYPIKIKCAGSWWKNLAPWKLSYFSLFYLSPRSARDYYRKCCRFLFPPPPSNFCFLLLFKMEKSSGGKAWVYPPMRVSQHENMFIFGEFSINWVLKMSKWKRECWKIFS